MSRSVFGFLLLVPLLFGPCQAAENTENGGEKLSATEKLYGLSQIWMEATYNFVFFDQVPELDWDAAYKDFIPQALEARSTPAYYRTLQRFTALLKDGHTSVYFPDGMEERYTAAPELQTQAVGRRAIISNAATALARDIPIGSEIVSVDGVATAEYLRKNVFPFLSVGREEMLWFWGIRGNRRTGAGLLMGSPGSEITLGLKLADGRRKTVRLKRKPQSELKSTEWAAERKSPPIFEMETLQDGIVLVHLNSFGNPDIVQQFEDALADILKARAVILDLRENGGGSSSTGYAIAAHFTAEPLKTSKFRTREHVAAFKAWGQLPEIVPGIFGRPLTEALKEFAEPYLPYGTMNAWRDGGEPDVVEPAEEGIVKAPVAVLIGPKTGSAAEDTAVLLDAAPHVTFIGTPTYGSTGQQVWVKLPGGGAARICAKRDTYPDGKDFVGPGVKPDITVAPTVADIRSARDPVLEKAVSFLTGKLSSR